jgi:hypothetical protein
MNEQPNSLDGDESVSDNSWKQILDVDVPGGANQGSSKTGATDKTRGSDKTRAVGTGTSKPPGVSSTEPSKAARLPSSSSSSDDDVPLGQLFKKTYESGATAKTRGSDKSRAVGTTTSKPPDVSSTEPSTTVVIPNLSSTRKKRKSSHPQYFPSSSSDEDLSPLKSIATPMKKSVSSDEVQSPVAKSLSLGLCDMISKNIKNVKRRACSKPAIKNGRCCKHQYCTVKGCKSVFNIKGLCRKHHAEKKDKDQAVMKKADGDKIMAALRKMPSPVRHHMRAAKESYNATVSESRQKGTDEILHEFIGEIEGVEIKPVDKQPKAKIYKTIELAEVPPVPPEINDEINDLVLNTRNIKKDWTKDNKIVILKVMYHFRNFFNAPYLARNCGLLDQILKTEFDLKGWLDRVRSTTDCPDWLKASSKNIPSPTKYKFDESQFSINEYCDILIKTPSVRAKFEKAKVPEERVVAILKLVEGNDWKNALESTHTKLTKTIGKKLSGSVGYANMCLSGNDVDLYHDFIEKSFMIQAIEKDGFKMHFIRWRRKDLPISTSSIGRPELLFVPDERFNDKRFTYSIEWHIIFLCCLARRLGEELSPSNQWGNLYAFYQVMMKGKQLESELDGSHENGIKQSIDVLVESKGVNGRRMRCEREGKCSCGRNCIIVTDSVKDYFMETLSKFMPDLSRKSSG